jgi:hypothetical protein
MNLATPPIRIGTRGSVLALAQANWVKRRIEQRCPEASVEIRVIRTGGERFSEAPMQILRGKGVFTEEIEDALLAGHTAQDTRSGRNGVEDQRGSGAGTADPIHFGSAFDTAGQIGRQVVD